MGKAKKSPVQRYIITGAQACYHTNKDGDTLPWGGGKTKAKPHKNLLAGFETMQKSRGAKLLIDPIAGKNTREDILHEDLADREDIFKKRFYRLNSNIQIRDLVVPAQNVDPATGKGKDISKYNSSIIFPHSKQRFSPIPVFNANLPRYLFTTGCVTLPNYNVANHRGDQAERDHVFGGLFVEIIDDKFYNIRNIKAQKNGKFVDLGVLFDGHKKPKKIGTDTLVLGDIHFGDHDEKTIQANYEMIDFFKPKALVLHDFFNGYSINHHEEENALRRIREFKRGRLNLEHELEQDYRELARLSKQMGKRDIYIVSSNHHVFLPRYINQRGWRNSEIWNAEICAHLFEEGTSLEIPESEIDDASYLIEAGFKRFGKIPSKVHFLRARDDLRRLGYQLASHGDKGSGGSRGGSARTKEVIGGGRSITGHTHKMEIYGDTYIVGTSSKLDLPYTFGYGSASIAANAVIYEDIGTVQMLPIIGGKWKAKD
tara:strand:- start:1580 stop:3034 length:1455 start_codon:yes stop_codon:yes gene_type:complete